MKYKKICIIILIISLFVLSYFLFFYSSDKKIKKSNNGNHIVLLDNLVGKDINYVNEYAKNNQLDIHIIYQYDDAVSKDVVISQSVEADTKLNDIHQLDVVISLGKLDYNAFQVNELGEVPVMMYHGIVDKKNDDTGYVGGNVDKDGYTRTSEAFRSDLELYYQKGYRMIRLDDYVDGKIDVEAGKSPIILTFDDGNDNNIKVLGKKNNGELIIDPNSAVGILEEFKNKYPDYQVTATFFVNQTLFNQDEYNIDILKWLVSHGYDVGNHTISHINFTKVDYDTSVMEVGKMYQILNSIIPNQFVSIVALPFGTPYNKEHSNYKAIIDGVYDGFSYHTKAGLRVGWKANESCFDKNFDSSFIKRIRAYDNNGIEFDIEMNFKLLENTRYISDGNINTVVVRSKDVDKVNPMNHRLISY